MHIVILLIFFCNTLFAQETLLEKQFSTHEISPYLRSQVPFLQNGQPEDNVYTLHFTPQEPTYEYFMEVVGRSIFRSVFVVSWYVLSDKDMPTSIDSMMALVNQKKPMRFVSMTHINGKWQSRVTLPYTDSRKTIVAYISYPNINGVLVPISAQVFQHTRQRTSDISTDTLDYWKRKNYL